jgi:hypothetical protein
MRSRGARGRLSLHLCTAARPTHPAPAGLAEERARDRSGSEHLKPWLWRSGRSRRATSQSVSPDTGIDAEGGGGAFAPDGRSAPLITSREDLV